MSAVDLRWTLAKVALRAHTAARAKDKTLPPRPNSSTNEILVTTIQLIAEHDVSGVSVDMIAERAGMSKATIYRRWPSRSELITEAMRYTRRPGVNPDTGSLRGDLQALLAELLEYLNRPDGSRIMMSLLNGAMRTPELAEIRKSAASDARSAYKIAIERGIKRGELDKPINTRLMIDMLIAPFLYQRLVENTKARRSDVDQIIDAALTAFGRKPS
jgi:AcrR family transcriptional regulator